MRALTSRRILVIMAVALFFATLLVAVTALKPRPIIIWNASNSVPVGFYLMHKRQPKIGEIAVISPPDWVRLYASSRGYLPSNAWLLKPVFALEGSIVCRFGRYVFVNGYLVARAKIYDRKIRLLPVWNRCRTLKAGEVFVFAKPSQSFDSRYFGSVNRSQIIGTAIRINFP